jgi:hypothetical protein
MSNNTEHKYTCSASLERDSFLSIKLTFKMLKMSSVCENAEMNSYTLCVHSVVFFLEIIYCVCMYMCNKTFDLANFVGIWAIKLKVPIIKIPGEFVSIFLEVTENFTQF